MSAYTYPIALAVISVFVAGLERFAPRRPEQPQLRRGLGWDLLHLVFNGHLLGVIFYGVATRWLLPPLDAHLAAWGLHEAVYRGAAATWPVWLQIPVALLAIDLLQYGVHRVLHRVPWLWRMHQCHHSVEDGEMDWVVAFRFQWTEVVVYRVLLYVPLAFFGFGAEAVMAHAIFGTLIGHLNHANLDLTWGPLRYVLNSPNMHLWHHDYDGTATTTKNFGIIFSLWDWLFGTAHMPDHPPARLGFPGSADFPRSFFAAEAWPLAQLAPERARGWLGALLGVGLLVGGWLLHLPAESPSPAAPGPAAPSPAAPSPATPNPATPATGATLPAAPSAEPRAREVTKGVEPMSQLGPRERPPGRRAFLRASVLGTGAAALATVGCGSTEEPAPSPAPVAPPTTEPPPTPPAGGGLPDGLAARNFLVHGRDPLTLETRRDRFGTSVITPTPLFFVRNNLPLPPASIVARADDWEVSVEGVREPRAVSVRELKTWGVDTVATVTQCSGNGRQFFEHETSGSQWGVGAAACTIWSGVPLRTVVERLGGALEGRAFLTATGGEVLPEGVERDSVVVERSIPRAKALEDCVLAWELNGEPIPITHGGPLRLIVPGYFGCNQIKYVKTLAFTERETEATIMRSGYRMRPIGESGAPDQPTMWEMNVKSWINGPSGRHPVARGPLIVHGVAFSGGGGVRSVEVSVDGGSSWRPAELTGPDLGRYAWRQFRFVTEVALGPAHFLCRATDGDGQLQPEHRVENHRGYGHNGWRDLGVRFEVVEGPVVIAEEDEAVGDVATGPAPGSVELDAEAQAGRELFVSDATPPCGTCHTLSEAGTTATVGPNLNGLAPSEAQIEAAVRNGVGAMPSYGATLTDAQIRQLAAYVRASLGGS